MIFFHEKKCVELEYHIFILVFFFFCALTRAGLFLWFCVWERLNV